MLANDDLAELVTLLEAKRRTLADRVQRISHHLGTQTEPEQSQADPGIVHQNDVVLERLSADETRELGLIDAALVRVHEGTYGDCIGCDESIPRERLAALPWALRCQACQQDEERRHA